MKTPESSPGTIDELPALQSTLRELKIDYRTNGYWHMVTGTWLLAR